MNTKNLTLLAAILLIVIGLVKPDLSILFSSRPTNSVAVSIEKPTNNDILDECQAVTNALQASNDRTVDGLKLASLYNDMATLISLDNEDMVIKNTEEIRQANKLVGPMLRLDIKGKYPELASAAEKLVIECIGDDSVMLDSKLRQNATESFKALAWACYEGAK